MKTLRQELYSYITQKRPTLMAFISVIQIALWKVNKSKWKQQLWLKITIKHQKKSLKIVIKSESPLIELTKLLAMLISLSNARRIITNKSDYHGYNFFHFSFFLLFPFY